MGKGLAKEFKTFKIYLNHHLFILMFLFKMFDISQDKSYYPQTLVFIEI